MQTVEQVPRDTGKPIILLSVLTVFVGAGGMAMSFLFLASLHPLDVVAGAVGFIAGSILVAAGLLSWAIQSRSPKTGETAMRITWCLAALLPPLVAILAWPVLYFTLFLPGLLLMPLVLGVCNGLAWLVSGRTAANLAVLLGWPHEYILRGIVFVLQVIAILASWPVFLCLFHLLNSMGYKVGWS